jgi:nitric oxide reductase subunit C
MENRDRRAYMLCIAALFAIFGGYNYTIYNGTVAASSAVLGPKALQGQELWHNNNCFSCHQLYGLGGYLGPDLTNAYSVEGKGPGYIKAFLDGGVKTMPRFRFTDQQKDALVAFLQEIDATGYYPDHNAAIHSTGWVEINKKDEK